MSWTTAIDRCLGRFGVRHAVAVGLVLRLAWILFCPNTPTSDQGIYHQGAIDLLAGNGFINVDGTPLGFWPVGYSGLLVPAYALLGPQPLAAGLTNLLLFAGTVWGSYRLISDLWNPRAAAIGVWLLALNPTLILYTTCIASENAFFAGTTCFLAAVLRVGKSERWLGWALFAAGLLAVTIHVRPTVVLLAPLLPASMLYRGFSWHNTIVRGAVVALVAGLLLVPWSMRNQRDFGKFTPLSFNGAANLWMGNHEGSDGNYGIMPEAVRTLPIVEREAVLGKRARAFILANPGKYLGLCARRVVSTLSTDTIAAVWNASGLEARGAMVLITPLKALCTAAHWLLLLLAVISGVSLNPWRRGARGLKATFAPEHLGYWVCVIAFLAMAFPFVAIVGGNRYHLPLIPFSIALASAWIWDRLGQPSPDKQPAGT